MNSLFDGLLPEVPAASSSPAVMRCGYWLAFSVDHDPDAARECFRRRYGVDPARVEVRLGLLLAGPVPDQVVTR